MAALQGPRPRRGRGVPRTRSAPGIDRRTLLRNAALLGISVPTLNALLAACARRTDGQWRQRRVGGGALQIATPDNPVTWDITDDNPIIDDGLSPEAGPLLLYNYADYIGPGVVKSFEAQYGVEVKVSTFNDTDEMLTKIRTGAVPYDICFPSYDQISRMVTAQARAAAQPQLPRQPRQRLGRLPGPVVRRRGPLLGALQRLHDRPRLADRPGARRRRRDGQPLRRALGPGVRRQGGGDRRLAHLHGPGRAPRRHHRRQHRLRRRPRHDPAEPHRAGRGGEAEGDDLDVQRPPLGPARPVPDVVGRRRQRAVLPAGRRVRRRAALLVPRGRHGPGRQRPDAGAHGRQQPGARAPAS